MMIDTMAHFGQRSMAMAPTNTAVMNIAKRLLATIKRGKAHSRLNVSQICLVANEERGGGFDVQRCRVNIGYIATIRPSCNPELRGIT
jgi:hypothetical protein